MHQFKCPACNESHSVSLAMAGKSIKCPSCQQTITIPRATQKPIEQTIKEPIKPIKYFELFCPFCGQGLQGHEGLIGKNIRCFFCSKTFYASEAWKIKCQQGQAPQSRKESHGIFYYVFWGTLSLIATLILIPIIVGCILGFVGGLFSALS